MSLDCTGTTQSEAGTEKSIRDTEFLLPTTGLLSTLGI